MELMSSEFHSYSLKSHPDKLLVDHLGRVGRLSRGMIRERALNLGHQEKEILEDVAYLMGVTHDLGKATRFFQEYIQEEDERKKRSMRSKETTRHGLLSAFFTYAIIKEYLNQLIAESELRAGSETGSKAVSSIQLKRDGGMTDYLPVLSFLAVRRHHGNLINAMDEVREVDSEGERIIRVAEEQIRSMDNDKAELNEILRRLISDDGMYLKNFTIDLESITSYILKGAIRDIGRKEKRLIRRLGDKTDLQLYFVFQFLYSVLLDADKTDAGLGEADPDSDRLELPEDLVDRYRESRGFISNMNGINPLRNQIYEDAMAGVRGWDLEDRVLSLNVPTGTGKTLTSLSFALKLRGRLNEEKGYTPRIIYALPFLSIIDQNYSVFEDVLAQGGYLEDSRLLLKHHHLAEVSYKRADNEEYKSDESLLLLEGWNAEIIVTTFWQYFYTLFSNKNRLIRKFNKLANSIIILDEVQAVPHQYWQLIHDAITVLCEKFNSYVIFVTATEPLIFDEAGGEIKEIVQKKDEYFQGLDRIELILKIDRSLNLDEFKALVGEELIAHPDKDFLIVLNTISSASEVYRSVQGLQLEDTETFYLSTNVVPKERIQRIKDIKDIKRSSGRGAVDGLSRRRKVIVSTQLIEAGVDIDADFVYRDFAPMDSINQVAGRCNRNSGSHKGTVSVFILRDDRREFHKYIYDPFLIGKTLDILKQVSGPIRESEFLDLNNRYFKAVKKGMGDGKSQENLSCLSQLAFKDLSKRFKLIEEDYPRVDVFIEVDDLAEDIWRRYLDMRMEKNLKEKIDKKLRIKKEFSEYVISVPEKFARSLVYEDSEIGYISKAELPYYYDMETGFKREGAGEGSMII